MSGSFVTPWTVTHQAPLSKEFSRQEYWSGLPLPSPTIRIPMIKNKKRTDICTLMFIAALYTVVKRWKQHKHPSMDEWINSSMW